MSVSSSVLQSVWIGPEATPGAVDTNCTVQMVGLNVEFDTEQSVKELRAQGSRFPVGFVTNREWGSASIDGTPLYDELGWVLGSVLSAPTSTTISAATETDPAVGRHVFTLDPREPGSPMTYRLERGDDERIKATTFAILTDFELKFGEDATASGTLVCRKVEPNATRQDGPHTAAWLMTLHTAAQFTLSFGGATTTALTAEGITHAAIQAALEALPTVGAGNIVVSGSGPFVISAAADLSGKRLPDIQAASLDSGSAPTFTLGERGGFRQSEVEPIIPTTIELFQATTLAGLAAGKLEDALASSVKITNGRAPVWKQDGTGTFRVLGEGNSTVELNLTVEVGAEEEALVAAQRNKTTLYVRLLATGEAIQGAEHRYLEILMACQVRETGKHTDSSGVYARDFTLSSVVDDAAASIMITLQNVMTAY